MILLLPNNIIMLVNLILCVVFLKRVYFFTVNKRDLVIPFIYQGITLA